jgi:M61 glycyl aminopeptidase
MRLMLLRLTFALVSFILAALTVCARTAEAETPSLEVKISVTSSSPARVRVEGHRREGATVWSFRNFYGSAAGLAERIENFTLSDEGGAEVAARKLAPGEFTAARASTHFAYDIRLDPPAFAADEAHVSWLDSNRGLLMPADILPQPLADASLTLQLPAGWNVSTVEQKGAGGAYELTDADSAVFALGRDLRTKQGRSGRMTFTLTTAGDWAFADGEAAESIEEILDIYRELTRAVPSERAAVVLLPLSPTSAGNLWAAETRGSTVVLMSGRLPSKLAAKAQLDGSLTHELFHVWVPNGLALEGEYDWFYEGFTNYLALRVGMRRGQLTFNDYLDALGREFDAYRAARGNAAETSLVEASRKRWAGASSLVYHKGMLVAFLYDLTLMRATDGKSSFEDAYVELFRRHARGGVRVEGNRALGEILGGMTGMRDFVGRYVEGADGLSLSSLTEPFGLRVEPGGARTHVAVAASAGARQRELLRKLGYNEKLDAEAKKLHDQMRKRPPK